MDICNMQLSNFKFYKKNNSDRLSSRDYDLTDHISLAPLTVLVRGSNLEREL